MTLFFSKSTYLQIRFFISIIISIALIICDSQLGLLDKTRSTIDIMAYPVYFIVNLPRHIIDDISQILFNNVDLLLENRILKQKLLLSNNKEILLERYKQDNIQLRTLLNLSLKEDEQIMIAQVMSININNYNDQIIIDKGLKHGVYIGQPVIGDKGVVGQIIATNQFYSRVLLICDHNHALPVKILRNNMHIIIFGKGHTRNLQLECLPNDADIKIGDLLSTSGLEKRFPEGYPVAVVTSITTNHQNNLIVQAAPIVNFYNLRYLLLLWNHDSSNDKKPLSSNMTYRFSTDLTIHTK